MEQCHFIIPDPESFPSGGNYYNRYLIQALLRLGVHVSHSAFQPNVLLSSPDTLYLLDSLFFEAVTTPDRQIPPGCFGLVHHLNSLWPLSTEYFAQREKPVLDHLSGYIVTSRFTRQYLSDRGIDAAHIHVIEPAPRMQHIHRTADPVVHALMLGSCIPRKAQLSFLEALAEDGPALNYSLTIAGSLTTDSVYARQCQRILKDNPLLQQSVRFAGEQQTAEIQRLYAEHNVFISASEMETFGMAIQDAVVSGMPVLVQEGGYAAEHVVQGQNGFRCANSTALVQAFCRCVEDNDNFIALQQRSSAFDYSYNSWDVAAKQLLDILQSR